MRLRRACGGVRVAGHEEASRVASVKKASIDIATANRPRGGAQYRMRAEALLFFGQQRVDELRRRPDLARAHQLAQSRRGDSDGDRAPDHAHPLVWQCPGVVQRPHSSSPEALVREGVARARLEVALKVDRALFVLEAHVRHQLPGSILGCVRRLGVIVCPKALLQVRGDADVALVRG